MSDEVPGMNLRRFVVPTEKEKALAQIAKGLLVYSKSPDFAVEVKMALHLAYEAGRKSKK